VVCPFFFRLSYRRWLETSTQIEESIINQPTHD
jgi:hypothetical protein